MPEGPEIRKAADKIAQAIAGKSVIKLEFGLSRLKKWEAEFAGMQVASVETYGKAMLTRFENKHQNTAKASLSIYSHNQLYGRWVCCPANLVPPSTRQLRIGIYTVDNWALLYSASDIFVLHDAEVPQHPFIKKLGRDVLKPETTTDHIVERLISPAYRHRQIGGFLTEQSFLAGLGNYLRCDILFVAGIHPARKPSELGSLKIRKLAEEIIRIPRQSYQTESITNDLAAVDKLMAQGSSLEDARFWVFRREGLPCYRCGEKIIKKKTGGQPCWTKPLSRRQTAQS
jgi:endonuclease-8